LFDLVAFTYASQKASEALKLPLSRYEKDQVGHNYLRLQFRYDFKRVFRLIGLERFRYFALTLVVQYIREFFLKKWAIPDLFFFIFSSFQYTVDMFNKNNFLPMTGFEPWTSSIRSYRSTNWATTTALASFVNYTTWNF